MVEGGAPPPLERPRHRLVSARVSPMVELARWLFERYRIPYHEEAHAPVLHVLATRRYRGGDEVPVVVAPEGVWKGALEVLAGIDARTRPGERLFGEDAPERAENRTLVERLLGLLLQTVRRYVYFHLLPLEETLRPIATEGAPAWERAVVRRFYPRWRRLMARGLNLAPDLVAEAPGRIREAFALVEAELDRRGTRFVGGDRPGVVDIVFSALAAPVVLPPSYGAMLPALDRLPGELRGFVGECRGRRAGALVLETYEVARPRPQPPLPAPGSERWSPLSLLTGPGVQRLVARSAARLLSRPLRLGRLVVASRWEDVAEILRRDLDFRIAPVNGRRIEEVSGPFVLGLDRGDRLAAERSRLYHAVAAVDPEAVRAGVAAEAERLLDDAAVVHRGRVDAVNGYARLVAARTAVRLFGVAGPTEADLTRVARALFHHTFLNLPGDAEVAGRAAVAARELRAWLDAEIEHRRRAGLHVDDITGRMMLPGPEGFGGDDDAVRRNVAGLLVGSIDTTATAVGNVLAVLGRDRRLLARVERDADDPGRMLGWCREALRLRPHNPILLRRAVGGTSLGDTRVPAGAAVVAYTHAAMFDAGRFPGATRLDPARPAGGYLHFGGGLHPCAGRAVNDVQIPELVRRVVRRGITAVARPRSEGPFIDELVVTVRERSAR